LGRGKGEGGKKEPAILIKIERSAQKRVPRGRPDDQQPKPYQVVDQPLN